MKKFFLMFGCFVILVLLFSNFVICLAEKNNIPKTINVQGKLTTASGQALGGKDYGIALSIYEGSTFLFKSQTLSGTLDANGLYNEDIDISSFFLDGHDFSNSYSFDVEITVDGKTIKSGKKDFASSPYAFYASTSAYSIKASSLNINGVSGYVWGVDETGNQNWINVDSLSISKATKTTVGGIKLGNDTGLSSSIDSDAILRVTPATNTKIGGVKIGANISVDSAGTISVSTATDSVLGLVKVSKANGLSITGGKVAIAKADESNFGTVKLYKSLGTDEDGTVTQKLLSNELATKQNTLSPGDGITISGNTISAKVDGTNIVIRNGMIDLGGNGADLAEIYKSVEKLVPGDIVSIDTTKDDSIVKTKVAEDTLVAGVISTEPGVLLNKTERGYKLALVGKVPTNVCNEGGIIKRGDLLVSASLAGYAKKAGDNPKTGTIIGKALENFDSQKGTILVLVNLQ